MYIQIRTTIISITLIYFYTNNLNTIWFISLLIKQHKLLTARTKGSTQELSYVSSRLQHFQNFILKSSNYAQLVIRKKVKQEG